MAMDGSDCGSRMWHANECAEAASWLWARDIEAREIRLIRMSNAQNDNWVICHFDARQSKTECCASQSIQNYNNWLWGSNLDGRSLISKYYDILLMRACSSLVMPLIGQHKRWADTGGESERMERGVRGRARVYSVIISIRTSSAAARPKPMTRVLEWLTRKKNLKISNSKTAQRRISWTDSISIYPCSGHHWNNISIFRHQTSFN